VSIIKPIVVSLSKDRKLYNSINRIIGFYPGNISLYKLAFTYKSLSAEPNDDSSRNNERLEFLGDAVIDTVIAEHLFKTYPYRDEGFLTEMRAKLVSRSQLNKLGLKLGLDKFLQESSDSRSKSICGDVFEALVGAIYLDRGMRGAKRFLIDRIMKFHVDLDEMEAIEVNFKGKIIDWCQKRKKEIEFRTIEERGPGQNKLFKVQVFIDNEGFGIAESKSKKRAEQRAAEATQNTLQIGN